METKRSIICWNSAGFMKPLKTNWHNVGFICFLCLGCYITGFKLTRRSLGQASHKIFTPGITSAFWNNLSFTDAISETIQSRFELSFFRHGNQDVYHLLIFQVLWKHWKLMNIILSFFVFYAWQFVGLWDYELCKYVNILKLFCIWNEGIASFRKNQYII